MYQFKIPFCLKSRNTFWNSKLKSQNSQAANHIINSIFHTAITEVYASLFNTNISFARENGKFLEKQEFANNAALWATPLKSYKDTIPGIKWRAAGLHISLLKQILVKCKHDTTTSD